MSKTQSSEVKPVSERINLKDPRIAAVLAYLIPGAGHLYQGRIFKGVLFSVCILTTFFCGVVMGEGRTVYLYYYSQQDPMPRIQKRNYGYLSQFLVGLPALPAFFQAQRYESPTNSPAFAVYDEFEVNASGEIVGQDDDGEDIVIPVEGTIRLRNADDFEQQLRGIFYGRTMPEDGGHSEEVEVEVEGWLNAAIDVRKDRREGDSVPVERPIYAESTGMTEVTLMEPEKLGLKFGKLTATWPRSFWNWYQVPLEDGTLRDLNHRLGKYWELALVFTWIAGLLNVLAIWDAFEGPAYGYGDEPPEKPDDEPEAKPAEVKPETAQPATV